MLPSEGLYASWTGFGTPVIVPITAFFEPGSSPLMMGPQTIGPGMMGPGMSGYGAGIMQHGMVKGPGTMMGHP